MKYVALLLASSILAVLVMVLLGGESRLGPMPLRITEPDRDEGAARLVGVAVVGKPQKHRTISLLVVAQRTRAAVVGANVSLVPPEGGGTAEGTVLVGATNKYGLLTASKPAIGSQLLITHTRYQSARIPVDESETYRVALEGSGRLRIDVESSSDHKPIQGGRVLVLVDAKVVAQGDTDAWGSVDLRGIPAPSNCLVKAMANGFAKELREVRLESEAKLRIRLHPAVELTLHAEIPVRGSEGTSSSSYRLTLYGVLEGGQQAHLASGPAEFLNGRHEAVMALTNAPHRVRGILSGPGNLEWKAEAPVEEVDAGRSYRTTLLFSPGVEPRTVTIMRGGSPLLEAPVWYGRDGEVWAFRTDVHGSAALLIANPERLRFWSIGLVSPPLNLDSSATHWVVELSECGGMLRIAGWKSFPEDLQAEEVMRGTAGLSTFRPQSESELALWVPPGRYRLLQNGTPVDGSTVSVADGQKVVLKDYSVASGSIAAVAPIGAGRVHLYFAAEPGVAPVEVSTGPEEAERIFFDSLPPGYYVLRTEFPQGRQAWAGVLLHAGEAVDIGRIDADGLKPVTVRLADERGDRAASERVAVWEGAKESSVRDTLTSDADGTLTVYAKNKDPLVVAGRLWAAILPAGLREHTLTIPTRMDVSRAADSFRVVFDQLPPRRQALLWYQPQQARPFFRVLPVEGGSSVRIAPEPGNAETHIYDGDQVFYTIPRGTSRASPPRETIVPSRLLPPTAASWRIRPVRVAGADISQLGYGSRVRLITPDDRVNGISLYISSGWDVQVDFPGAGGGLRISVNGDDARITQK